MHEGTDSLRSVVTGSEFRCGCDSAIATTDSIETNGSRHSLRNILPASRFLSTDDLIFHSLAETSAAADRGQLVVYRIGEDCPSRLVADAMARGAAGILTEQVLPCPLPQCIVGDIDLAMAHIASHLRGRPDRGLLNVAVIGSSGKTTTTLLIASLLRSSGIRTAYCSDLGDSDGIVQSTPDQAVPSGSDLVDWLGDAVDSQCKASVIEISEEKARHGHYDSIEFDIVVVTGVTTGRGDFGPSGLQCVLERLTRDGVVIAPVDDSRAMQAIRETGSRVVTYGVRKAADLTAKIIDQSSGVTTLLVSHRETSAVMETTLCGADMAANHAAAALVGLLIAQPLQEVVDKLGQLRSIPGRGQRLTSHGHATVVLEVGGSPERIASALRTHRSMKGGGRLWCLLAIDHETPDAVLARYGSNLERFANCAIVTSTPSSKPHFLAASHHVLDGVERCASFRLVADRGRALEWVMGEASSQDTIVVFTNESKQTAHGQRTDLEQLARSVEEHRASRHNPPESPSAPHLSIFG